MPSRYSIYVLWSWGNVWAISRRLVMFCELNVEKLELTIFRKSQVSGIMSMSWYKSQIMCSQREGDSTLSSFSFAFLALVDASYSCHHRNGSPIPLLVAEIHQSSVIMHCCGYTSTDIFPASNTIVLSSIILPSSSGVSRVYPILYFPASHETIKS